MKCQIFFLGFLINFSSSSDPCGNHTVLENPWRSTECPGTDCTGQWMCDKQLTEGWYRFKSSAGWKIPEQAVSGRHCSTDVPIWLNGSHPTVGQGEATRVVCFTKKSFCCYTLEIKIKNCSDYFVYELKPPPHCYAAYCTDPSTAPEPESRESTLPTSTDSGSQIPTESPTPDPSTAPEPEAREFLLPTSTDSGSQIPTESPTPDIDYQMINVEVTSMTELDDETAKRVALHKVKQMFQDQCPKEPIDWNRVEVQCSDVDEPDP